LVGDDGIRSESSRMVPTPTPDPAGRVSWAAPALTSVPDSVLVAFSFRSKPHTPVAAMLRWKVLPWVYEPIVFG
jgi:hypothetical protein